MGLRGLKKTSKADDHILFFSSHHLKNFLLFVCSVFVGVCLLLNPPFYVHGFVNDTKITVKELKK
jgi:hypothetical protein